VSHRQCLLAKLSVHDKPYHLALLHACCWWLSGVLPVPNRIMPGPCCSVCGLYVTVAQLPNRGADSVPTTSHWAPGGWCWQVAPALAVWPCSYPPCPLPACLACTLQACHNSAPPGLWDKLGVRQLAGRDGFRCLVLSLWDADQRCYVPFPEWGGLDRLLAN
jgi:hypothetical protein